MTNDEKAQARLAEILAAQKPGGRSSDGARHAQRETPVWRQSAERAAKPASREPFREPVRDPKRHPFEVYVTGYTTAEQTTANCFCAWGTVLNSEDDIADVVEITKLDDAFTLAAGDWVYLKVVFGEEGDIASCELKTGAGWSGYPSCYKAAEEGGNEWYHPIALVRESRTAKNSEWPDSGEFPDLKPGKVISQLTHTHLVKTRACAGDDAMTRIWKLVPGQGGKQ